MTIQVQSMIISCTLWVKDNIKLLVPVIGVMIVYLIFSIWIEDNNLKAEIKSLRGELYLIKEENQILTDQNEKLIDQNDKLTEDNQQLVEQREQHETSHGVIVRQISYIKKWINPIGKLEEHIHYVIRYCKLMNKFYADYEEMDRLRQQIAYDIEEGDDEIIVPLAVELIMKFKKNSDKLMNALRSMDFEEMKQLQDSTSTDKIEKMMDDFLNEVAIMQLQKRVKAQKEAEAKTQESTTASHRGPATQQSSTTAVQSSSWKDITVGVAYKLLSWVGKWLFS